MKLKKEYKGNCPPDMVDIMAAEGKIVYCEPQGDKDTTITITKREAIKHQRMACLQARGEDVYNNDGEALSDFITVNWAWFEKEN